MIKKFNNQDDLAKDLALFILTKIKGKKIFVLGCPGGRSLKKTYYYLGVLSSKLKISLDHLIIIMMDEYVEKNNNRYQLVDSNAHYSCVRFSRKVIKKLINFKKPLKHKLKDQNIFFPTINKPSAYDQLIQKLGGIDIFLLASGSSDGHVAFNNSKTSIIKKTHIIKLSDKTRRDNMKTFPKFKSLSNVPKYGITVGLGTISQLTKLAIIVLSGKEKRLAVQNIIYRKTFSNKWPSTIIHKCKKKLIYVDQSALFK